MRAALSESAADALGPTEAMSEEAGEVFLPDIRGGVSLRLLVDPIGWDVDGMLIEDLGVVNGLSSVEAAAAEAAAEVGRREANSSVKGDADRELVSRTTSASR